MTKGKHSNLQSYLTCGGTHLSKARPNQKILKDFLDGKLNQCEGEYNVMDVIAKLLGVSFNQIIFINNVKGVSKASNPHASLIHIKIEVQEQSVMSTTDTWATHTFLDVKITLTKSPSQVKTVNTKAKVIEHITTSVPISAEHWVGKHNIMVMPLGEFEIVLEIDFLRNFMLVSFPHSQFCERYLSIWLGW